MITNGLKIKELILNIFAEVSEKFSHGLAALLKRFDIECEIEHRAMALVQKAQALLISMLKKLYDEKYNCSFHSNNELTFR